MLLLYWIIGYIYMHIRKAITECVSTTFQAFLAEADKNELQYVTELNCVHQKYKETVLHSEREDYKLTVKIFLCQNASIDVLQEAVDRVLSELEVSFIETVLLSFPENEKGEELTLEVIKRFWKALETIVFKETILTIGVSDLDKNLLEQLHDWAEVKPAVNQVNLDSCCVMPKDLVEYAKLKDIQLLTHNDPRTILPADSLQNVLHEVSTERDSEHWEPLWVLRYSILVKCRGIVKSKGYILKAERDIRKRK
ncbi:glutamate--cysteine ligase regulatory subunit-like isoform X2 [Dreissena polymorpha]|uniref:glutamate--cysteine ligase regulatory subunit-like isoform X2 n=1 Tax=Dreissena polymorpha TaxID=45954 RepID=UPI0022641C32|nr:glutamate--cysteine ligase regulatory subunit-like isoform X2 [Dreissena polymorpha]